MTTSADFLASFVVAYVMLSFMLHAATKRIDYIVIGELPTITITTTTSITLTTSASGDGRNG